MNPFNGESTTRMDIGLSKDDLERIDELRTQDTAPRLKIKNPSIFSRLNQYAISLTRIKLRDKVTFFQLLGVMIHSGMPIIRSLSVLADQTTNPRMQQVIKSLASKMEAGTSLSDAMESFPKIFSEAEVGMIASGEVSGNLNVILKDVSLQEEKAAAVVSKVKGAMIYPIVIMIIMSLSAFLMLTLVVPKLVTLFEQGEQELPRATRMLIAASDFALHQWKLLLFIIFLICTAAVLIRRSKRGRYATDLCILYIPIFGRVFREVMIARFARTLATLTNAGIPIVKALEIDANALGNVVYKRRISFAAQDVTQGIPLGENLKNSDLLFPPMVASMISIGEKTANLAEVSSKVADYYEEQIDNTVNSLSKLIEPVILLFMGAMVAFLVAAIMGPIISLTDLVSTM